MKDRFMLKVAVYLLLKKGNKTLFMKRAGSGYMDGFYGLPSGHVEENETLKMAMIREAKEEINIDIEPQDLHLELTLHRNSKAGEYIDLFFSVSNYKNSIRINEPEKCHELGFFAIDELQDKIVPYVKECLKAIDSKQTYLEANWDIK